MEEALHTFFINQPSWALGALIVALLAVLGRSADKLVGQAVLLSQRSGLPKVVIGATIVSLGTTSPEAAVSVLAALQGSPDVALGNAVGSIICDTGLILGIACLISPPHLPRKIVNRQGWLQFGAGVLLVALSWPTDGSSPFQSGGNFSQWAGFVCVALLGIYLWLSVRWARTSRDKEAAADIEQSAHVADGAMGIVIIKLLIAIALVLVSSSLLIPGIDVAAVRLGVPKGVVASTLIAFGTSLPELVTAVTASLKGHGDLAIGNVIGADILNVLFVVGLSAAVTPAGLVAEPYFFHLQFPAMLAILVIFRIGIFVSADRLKRPFGVVLLVAYLIFTALNFSLIG